MPTPATQPRHSRARGFSYRLLILSDDNAQHYTAVDRIRVGRQRSAILFIYMSLRKNLQKLSHAQVREIVGLCSGALLLLLAAVFLSGGTGLPVSLNTAPQGSQAAATALGNTQGVPPGYTGQTYPAQTTCYINRSYWGYGAQWTPLCTSVGLSTTGTGIGFGAGGTSAPTYGPIGNGSQWGVVNDTDNFATGVFSVDLGGTGQSVYAARTYTVGGILNVGYFKYCPSGYTDGGDGACYNNSNSNQFVYLYPTYICPSGYTMDSDSGMLLCGNNSSPYNYVNALWNPVLCSSYATPAGGTAPYAYTDGDGNSYCASTIAGGLSAPINTTNGAAITVNPGQSMTMEWSCLPSRTVNWEMKSGMGTFSSGGWSYTPIYSLTLASSVTGSGPSFYPGGLTGTQTFAAPSTGGTYNYTLTCNGGTGAMTIPVTVNAPPPSPTATISINGQPSGAAQTVYSGSPVTITATYAPVTGALAASGINGNDQITSVPCAGLVPFNASCWTQPDVTKTYTFTPAVGTYSFYAAEKTTVFYTTYNNYKSVTLTVVNQCPNGSGPTGSCTSCNAGYVLSGGSCVLQCANGNGPTGACTSCNSGFNLVGGSCVPPCPANCPGPGAPSCTANSGYTYNSFNNSCTLNPVCPANCPGTYPSCVANGGYTYNSGSNTCTLNTPTITTFSTNPTRVRKNTSTNVTFSWVVSNPPASNPSCTISGPSGFTTINLTQAQVNVGSWPATPITISQPSFFTLTCGVGAGAVTKKFTEGLIPTVIEI